MNMEKLFYTDLITFSKSDLITLAKYYKIPITLDYVKEIAKKQANLYKKGNMNSLPNNFHECSNDIEIFSKESWKDLYDRKEVKDPIMLNVYNSNNNIIRKECAERANILHDINDRSLIRKTQNNTQIFPINSIIKYYITRDTIDALSDNSKLYALKPIGEFDYTFVRSSTIQGKTIVYNVYSLLSASNNGDLDIVKEMIKDRVDPNIQDKIGNTALMWASDKGHLEIVTLLIQSGAVPNIQNENGKTALMQASNNGYLEIVKLLLEFGANPNIQDIYDGNTALIFASDKGHLQIVKLLIKYGADPNIKTNDSTTALMWASDKGHLEIVKLLALSGADINAQDETENENEDEDEDENYGNEETALIRASRKGYLEIVKLLIEFGANPNIQNDNGKTAFDVAKNDSIRQLLKDYKIELGFKATQKYMGGKVYADLPIDLSEKNLKNFDNKKLGELAKNLGITLTNKSKLELVDEIFIKLQENNFGKVNPRKLEILRNKMCKNLNDEFNLPELGGMAKALGFDYKNKTKSELCAAIATKIFVEKGLKQKLGHGDYKG